jgi:hypothetical protein
MMIDSAIHSRWFLIPSRHSIFYSVDDRRAVTGFQQDRKAGSGCGSRIPARWRLES